MIEHPTSQGRQAANVFLQSDAPPPESGERPVAIGLVLRYQSGAVVTKSFSSPQDVVSYLATH